MLVNERGEVCHARDRPCRTQRCGGFTVSTVGRQGALPPHDPKFAQFRISRSGLDVLLAHPEYMEHHSHGCNYQYDRSHERRPTKRSSIGTLVHRSDGIDAPGDLHPAYRRQETGRGGQ